MDTLSIFSFDFETTIVINVPVPVNRKLLIYFKSFLIYTFFLFFTGGTVVFRRYKDIGVVNCSRSMKCQLDFAPSLR
jgi:hypothetical protein